MIIRFVGTSTIFVAELSSNDFVDFEKGQLTDRPSDVKSFADKYSFISHVDRQSEDRMPEMDSRIHLHRNGVVWTLTESIFKGFGYRCNEFIMSTNCSGYRYPIDTLKAVCLAGWKMPKISLFYLNSLWFHSFSTAREYFSKKYCTKPNPLKQISALIKK